MSKVKKIWKLLLAVVLFAAAAWTLFSYQTTQEPLYVSQENTLNTSMQIWQQRILENNKYKDKLADFEKAIDDLDASRLALYQHFPLELREEDQIMYVLYLEQMFGTEIQFSFSSAQFIANLTDGGILGGVVLTVNYESTYKGFQDMVNYLSTDSRITSLQNATMDYDEETGIASGEITLVLYILDSDLLEYKPPEVFNPETGKDNIFD